jgi:hypothetical protein
MNVMQMYISALMFYIEQEYEDIPEMVTPEMDEYFLKCFDEMTCFPNAAGVFVDNFIKSKA